MNTCKEAILYFTYLLVYSDGEYDESEKSAIDYIRSKEAISDDDYQKFLLEIDDVSEREIYEKGVDLVEACTLEERLIVFVWLYKLSEADGTVHAKEIRFLLYSLRKTGVDFDSVKKAASLIDPIPLD